MKLKTKRGCVLVILALLLVSVSSLISAPAAAQAAGYTYIQHTGESGYIYYAPEGRSSSQTLVPVVNKDVLLETHFTLDAPGNPIGMEVFKRWYNSHNGAMIANAMAGDVKVQKIVING